MPVMRFTGTSIWRESSAAVMPSSRNSSARCSPGWMGVRAKLVIPSVIVDDLHIDRARRSIGPREADPPLIVYSNRELPGTIAFECFKSISRQCGQIGEAGGRVKAIKPQLGLPSKARKFLDVPSGGKPFGRLVPIADDHGRFD